MKNLLKGKLAFLTSVRFWKVVIAFILVYLGSVGVLAVELVTAITGILGVSVIIRTADRLGEKLGGRK